MGYTSPSGSTKVVVRPGEPSSPDSQHIAYYGSVHKVGDELWMWYLGQGEQEDWFQRVCFAKSIDGYSWEKLALGLVSYQGNKNNNLIDLSQASYHVQSLVVFYDPNVAESDRCFKMAFQSPKYNHDISVAFSPDGINWTESRNNPVGRYLEIGGGTRFNGTYYLTGQSFDHPNPARQLITYVSDDFEHWDDSFCIGLNRGDPLYSAYGLNSGKQVHLGAALWNRGNVIIGFYGKWDGHPSNDRRLASMDLGIAVTNDGLHYREPIRDFPIVSAAEDGWAAPPIGDPRVKYPALMQGQGFENIGDKILFWYGPWPEQKSSGVRVASWKRDQLSYFQVLVIGDHSPRKGRSEKSYVTSAPINLEGEKVQLFLNADGLQQHSKLTVEVLDERFDVLQDYSKKYCLGPEVSGLFEQVRWSSKKMIDTDVNLIRIRVHFEGIRREDIKL